MRVLRAIIPLLLTITLVYALNRPIGPLPAVGPLLDPMNGAWAGAEASDEDFNANLNLAELKQPVTVWYDDRLVPHIKAANDHDLYYVQGYVHAYFRLWQMDMQTRAAGGRVSEVVGAKALNFDREQRRKGMVFGAEQSLKAMEAEPRTKAMLDAYKAGINHYISTISFKSYPIEYKLMGFEPEPWTNIKSALLLKYMADDLTGATEDIPLTVLRDALDSNEFALLFPQRISGSTPVIPVGTTFDKPSLQIPPAPPDSIAFAHLNVNDFVVEDIEGKGSNNWALSGSRTKSGAPILCNDPHLGLNLPSLWYEIQLTAPGINVYGVSLPGAPGVVIGFNDSISWGFTNNYRDVKDFYAIQYTADSNAYIFEGKQMPFEKRVERIGIKGAADYLDTVRYTLHGPVMYENRFHGPGGLKRPLAVTWMAHRSTNEMLSLYLLNRAKNYNEYTNAIHHFQCPGQNMIYADRQGNIALWGQGQFVNKWKGQGRYVMNGTDSSTLWQQLIPMSENPHVMNPAQGFISSANQTVTDSTYPYWYNGMFYEFRGWRINQVLNNMHQATVQDMFALQNDVYSYLAANSLPLMLRNLDRQSLDEKGKKYASMLDKWDYKLTLESEAATVFQTWSSLLHTAIWDQKFGKISGGLKPSPERTMQLLQMQDTIYRDAINISYKQTMDSLGKLKNGLQWYKVKNTSVNHLTKLPAFSYTGLKIGGWGNAVNAVKGNHGPSWRMVVQMGKEIEAYGVYPGGQSGNPYSKYYASFLDNWVDGKYYKLQFLAANQTQKPSSFPYTWTIQPK